MCMVLGLSVSFQSCKDYDNDINNLNNRIDGVITDLNSLKETVNGLVKSVTYDGQTGVLTVTPVTGNAVTYTIAQNVPQYELKVDGSSCWLEKDGQQIGDKLTITMPEIPEIPEIPAEFDPSKLSVKTEGGKYCIYYNGVKTGAEIPVPAEVTLPTNSIVKLGNEITITLGEQSVSFTLSAGDALKSLVFEPQAYLNGVEAMKARGINAAEWTVVTSDVTPSQTGEVWKKGATKVKIGAKVVAYYHANPSTVDEATIKAVSFITKNREQVVTRAAANELGAKLESYKIVKGADSDSPMLQVIFTVDADKIAAFDANKLSTLAVQATVQEVKKEGEEAPASQIITSDYAAVFNTTITDFRLASNDEEVYAGMDADNHLWGTVSGKAEDAIKSATPTDGAPDVIPVVYDNTTKVKLEDYVVSHYTEVDYKGDNLVNCDKAKALSREDLKALGLNFRFKASNYITGQNETPQNEFFSVNEKNGEVTVKVYGTEGTAAIGRMPLVRVELYDTLSNKIVNVGWIKLLIVRENTPGLEKTKTFDPIKWGCNGVDNKVDVEFMNTEIYNELGLSKDDFHAIYTINTTNTGGNGTLQEIVDPVQHETTIVEWTLSDNEIKTATDGQKYTAKVIYSAKGRKDVVINLEVVVNHPKAAKIGKGITEYWGDNYVRLNVEVVDDNNNCDFTTNLLNTFTGNKLELTGKDASFTDFATLTYKFEFSAKNNGRKVKGQSGQEYTLSVSTDGTQLLSGATVIAELADVPGAAATQSKVTYQDNDIAKDLLNKAGHLELGENQTFYAWMNVKATNDCDLEYPLSNGVFKAFFLRPVDVKKQPDPATMEDAATNGSTINLMDLIELKDWREKMFVFSPVNFYQYYKVEQVVALAGDYADDVNYPIYTSLNGGDINKTKLSSVTSELVLTATEGQIAGGAADEAALANYGTLTLKNNGAAVGAFKLNVPVKVVYKWGEVIQYIVIDVKATQGN